MSLWQRGFVAFSSCLRGKVFLTVFFIFIRVSYSSVSQLIWVYKSSNFLVFRSQKDQFTFIAGIRYTELCRVTKPVWRVFNG